MSTFVLVHGASHTGDAWREVVRRLEDRGHVAFAPTLAGHGRGADRRVTHAGSTSSLVDYIVDHDLDEIVLVGHSYGGSIISKVAELIPQRLRRLVFWTAFVLRDGESMLELFPVALQQELTALAAASEDNTVTLPFEIWRRVFVNDADEALARRTYAHVSPQSFAQLTEPIELKTFHSLGIPRSYLVGTEDLMPPGDDSWHTRMARRLGSHRYIETPGGHEALFTTPITLADSIIEAGRDA
jgi:pimeloyl-ACP methyl ester carboxylesterase